MSKRNLSGFALGPVLLGAASLVAVPLSAWLFSPDDVGRLNVLQIVLSFGVLIFSGGLDQAYVREYHGDAEKDALFLSCVLPGALALITAFVLGVPFSSKIARALFDAADTSLYLLAGMSIVGTYAVRFFGLVLRMEERGLAFSIVQALSKILFLAFLTLAILAPQRRTFSFMSAAMAAANIISAVVVAWLTRDRWVGSWPYELSATRVRKLLSYGLPLIVASFAYWAIGAVTTFGLRSLSSLSELAIYSVAMSFAGPALLVQAVFSAIWTPLAFKWESTGVDMRRVDEVSQTILALISALWVIAGILAPIASFLVPAHYHQVKYILMCTLVQPLLYTLSIVTSLGIGIARKNQYSILASVCALLVNAGLIVVLVPDLGASGAAIANAVSFLVMFVVNTECAVLAWRSFPRKRIYACIALATALSVLTAAVGPQFGVAVVLIWCCAAIGVSIVFAKEYSLLFAIFRRSIVL